MATTRIIAATPSPPPHIHTPTTPKHGFADSWEPFSPRKSSRIAAAAAAAAAAASSAPSAPAASVAPATPRHTHTRAQLRSPRVSKTLFHGSVMSPESTPRKKTMSTAATPEVVGGRVSSSSSSSKLAAAQQQARAHRASLGMLPTPAKTPSKKVHAASQNESNIAAIARNLFHTNAHSSVHTSVDEVMASPTSSSHNSPRKTARPKKYTGYTLESFTVVEEEEPIPIFTDSQDRVPEADRSSQNPFYGEGAVLPVATQEQPARRRSSRRNNVSIPGEGKQSVEEATRRDDGLVYVFRGKKIFRKFADVSAQEQDSPGSSAGMGSPERTAPGRRLTRSSIKPRLLFPRSEAAREPEHLQAAFEGTTEDEEAVTDIEEGNDVAEDEQTDEAQVEAEAEAEQMANTPTGRLDKMAPSTPPRAPRYAPASPPVTGRATRAKKRSPFDGWRQTKSSTAATGAATSHKRSGDDLGAAVSTPAKRSRAL